MKSVSVEIVWNGCSDSSSTLCSSGQSGSHVCAQIPWQFVCVEVSGLIHFYFGTVCSVSLIFSGVRKIFWNAFWRVCLWLRPCQGWVMELPLKVLCSLHIGPLHPWHYHWKLASNAINYCTGIRRWDFCFLSKQHTTDELQQCFSPELIYIKVSR